MAQRFIATGDLHFRSENPRNRKDDFAEALLTKLYEVFQIASDNEAEAIIIPGDIFDSVNIGLSTITKLAYFLKNCKDEFGIPILTICGNHDLPAGNKGALKRTPFGLLSELNFILDLEEYDFGGMFNSIVSGCGFDFQTDTQDGAHQFMMGEPYANTPVVQVVHSMLLASSPSFPMRHTLINQVETDADIVISGHYHEGFGIIRRKDGKLFINPGALCRLSASKAEMERTVQVALLTIRSKTDFDAELIPLQSARPAEEVLDREALVEKVEHENWLDSFFDSLDKGGEAKFLEVREIVDSIAVREQILPAVKEEALRRIGEAREKLGRAQ